MCEVIFGSEYRERYMMLNNWNRVKFLFGHLPCKSLEQPVNKARERSLTRGRRVKWRNVTPAVIPKDRTDLSLKRAGQVGPYYSLRYL